MKKDGIELTEQQLATLKRLEEMPDEQIDTSDIPEIRDSNGWFPSGQIPVVIKEAKGIECCETKQRSTRIVRNLLRERMLFAFKTKS